MSFNFQTFSKSIGTLFFSVCLISCDDDGPKVVGSDAVSTGRIFATFQVISDGGEWVHAEAQLTLDVPPIQSDEEDTYVRLEGDDELWLSAGTNVQDRDYSDNVFDDLNELATTQTRFKGSTTQPEIYEFIFFRTIINPFGNWYSAQLPQSDNRTYQVSLFRDNTDQAKNSTITLPQEFSIVGPDPLTAFSRSQDDIIVEWTNTEADTNVEIEATTACPDQSFDSFNTIINNDSGLFTISAGQLISEELVGRCTTTINIRKAKTGEFDPSFIGGTVSGYQIRRIVLNTDD